ncbi:MAG: sugar phosphate isomerase/epimerase family protein [Mycobacterium sp.]
MPKIDQHSEPISLTCSSSTLRRADLPTRVAAASAAGFTGLGFRVADYADSGMELPAIRDLLDRHAMRTLEVEHTWDWALRQVDPVEEAMFAFARAVGFRQLNVPMFYPHTSVELVRGFGELCDRAADFGVLVGFEFLPYSHVAALADAWAIVEAADRPNGGVIIDLWHWFRSDSQAADLGRVPVEKITSLQLCDVLHVPRADLTEEARHHRLLPGQGAGATARILDALHGQGFSGPVSVEVFSDDLDAKPTATAAGLAFDAGADVLRQAGIRPEPWFTNHDRACR